jgi:hypothetical protein
MQRPNEETFHGQQDADDFRKVEALRADLVQRLAEL